MSLRSDVENALIEVDRRYFQLTQSEFVSAATDAALVVVRSHVNRLADGLEAEAEVQSRLGFEVIADTLRDVASDMRALCEEQTEDEHCEWCDASSGGVCPNHASREQEAKP